MKFAAKLVVIWLMCWNVSAQAANIAVIAPKVGDLAKYGQELSDGAQIAVDMLNQSGGVLGEKVNLITVDDRCEDSFAVSAAQMMSLNSSKKDKVNLVIGPYCSNAFVEVADIYAQGKIIRIVPMPLNAGQYHLNKAGLFKTGGLMSEEAEAFFDTYKRRFAGKNVAMVYDSFLPETTETAFETQQLFRGNNLVNRITLYDFSNYNKDYTQMAKEILLNSQVVYVLSGSKPTARLVQELQEESKDAVIFVDEYLATPYFFREMGNFAEGIYVLAMEDLKDRPEFTEELVELRLKGKEPRGLGVYSYAAVKLWSEMVEKAKSADFDKVVQQSTKKSFMSPWGEVTFKQGNALQNGGYGVYQIKNGEYTQVN